MVTVGRIHAGTKDNIIPETAELGINIRTWIWGGADPQMFADAVAVGQLPPMNHAPQFAPVVEPTLTTGVQALTVAVLSWLAGG